MTENEWMGKETRNRLESLVSRYDRPEWTDFFWPCPARDSINAAKETLKSMNERAKFIEARKLLDNMYKTVTITREEVFPKEE